MKYKLVYLYLRRNRTERQNKVRLNRLMLTCKLVPNVGFKWKHRSMCPMFGKGRLWSWVVFHNVVINVIFHGTSRIYCAMIKLTVHFFGADSWAPENWAQFALNRQKSLSGLLFLEFVLPWHIYYCFPTAPEAGTLRASLVTIGCQPRKVEINYGNKTFIWEEFEIGSWSSCYNRLPA